VHPEIGSADPVAAFLDRHLGGVDASSVEAVGHGEWSRAFVFRQVERDLVVRFSAFDDDFLKDQRASAMAGSAVPIPKVVEIGQYAGGWFAISERAFGTFLEERDIAAMQQLLPCVFTTLDALREIQVSMSTGYGLWRGSDGCAPFATWHAALQAMADGPPSARLSGWQQALAARPEAQNAFDLAYHHMHDLIPGCPNARHLIHSDLLNFNVLVNDDKISAVLDWGSALYGDFLWDLAWLTFWQPWYVAWSTLDLRQAARMHYRDIGLEVPNFDVRLRCYELAIGLDGLAYQAWANRSPDDLGWTTRRVLELLNG
jgi:hygromycin-B 4-O-kinase